VAFEMAQQLHRGGERAELVALFNAPNRAVPVEVIEARRATTPRRAVIEGHWDELVHLQGRAKIGYVRGAIRQAVAWRRAALRDRRAEVGRQLRAMLCQWWLATGHTIPPRLRDVYVFQVTTRAEQRYAPLAYPGHLLVFRGKGLYTDPALGWGPHARSIETIEVGGPQRLRREIVAEPVVCLLARELRSRLDRLEKAPGVAAANF
jgi:thioesterase domain-containing protein